MNNIDWKTKLTSRKFWLSLVGFVTPLLIAFGLTDNSIAEVTAIIMSGAQLIAYVIGEGLVDANRTTAENNSTVESNSEVIK